MEENTINRDVTMSGVGASALLANRYRVIRQLGQGGMGSVWLAEDTQLDGKLFAIKMLPSILVSNKRAYKQLKDEALVAMKLVHPNIVQIRAFEENSGNPFLVMDYVDGETLDDYLAEKGPISEVEAVRRLRPVADALDYAHAEGVVHRDVKPANIMIRKDGRVFIMDFGIAREIQETMTRVTGKLSSGTLLYMSPEQLNGEAPKPSQDVYSFAAMAYECLKGEPPFCRGAIEDQIKNKLPGALPDSFSIAASILRGLAKAPEHRPKKCAGVLTGGTFTGEAQYVGDKRANMPARVHVPPRPKIPVSVAPSRSGAASSPRIMAGDMPRAAAVAVIVLLGLVGASVWYQQSSSARPPVRPPVPMSAPPTGPRESDITEIAVEAAVQKGKVEHISGEDGFKSKKYDLSELLTKATAYGKAKSWAKAAVNFTNYVEDCKALLKLDSARQAAKQRRDDAAAARRRAEAENAAKYATERWTAVCNIIREAEEQFSKMNFAESSQIYGTAVHHFEKCVVEAKTERERQARQEQERIAKAQKESARRAKWRRAGEAYTIEPDDLDLTMKWCPAGMFTMGSPATEVGQRADEIQHRVTLNKGFWMGETEVTQGQWKRIMDNETVADLARKGLYDDTQCCNKEGKMVTLREYWDMNYASDPMDRCGDFNDNIPVYNLNWHEAVEFCRRLTKREQKAGRIPDGYEYRLPTEAEWEYACRAGTSSALPNGLEMSILGEKNAPVLDNIAWYGGNVSVGFDGRGVDTSGWKEVQYAGGRAFTRGVKGKAANNWGLYDMIGNVWEWCYDLYGGYSDDVTDPIGASSGARRVLRGGGWCTQAWPCRSACRAAENPHFRAYHIGFRVALAPSHPGMPYPEAPVVTVPSEGAIAENNKHDNKRLAMTAFTEKRYREAYRLFMKSDLEDKAVQWFLGVMYANGHGVDSNDNEAAKWYRKAAEQGFIAAQQNLGIMYECGRGVARDVEEAKIWYRKAADKGSAPAKRALDRLEPKVVPVAPAAIPQNRKNQELVDRPYDLQFCRHCRMRLSHLKQVPKNCPQCGRNLFGR